MGKTIVALALALGVLVWADFALAAASGEARRASTKVRRLVPIEQREGKLIAALKLEGGGRAEPLMFARSEDHWRCLSYRRAVASEQLMKSVLEKVFEGEGIVQSEDPAKAATYGFDSPAMLRVSLHGLKALEKPQGDPLFSFDVGSESPANNGCYVRVTGSPEIWSIDANLRQELAPAEPSRLPPLVDRMLVPGAWPGARKGILAYRVEPPGAPPYELEGRRREIAPEDLKSGKSPIEWFVKRGDSEMPANEQLAMSFSAFTHRAPRLDVADPGLQATAGLENPRARLTIRPQEGEPLVVTVGSGQIGAGVPVVNGFSRTLDLVAPNVAALLTPRAEQLLATAGPNPWEPFLKQ